MDPSGDVPPKKVSHSFAEGLQAHNNMKIADCNIQEKIEFDSQHPNYRVSTGNDSPICPKIWPDKGGDPSKAKHPFGKNSSFCYLSKEN